MMMFMNFCVAMHDARTIILWWLIRLLFYRDAESQLKLKLIIGLFPEVFPRRKTAKGGMMDSERRG
jgi:hypothetical protein